MFRLVQLLRRRQRWILSFDVGDDPNMELLDLHTAIALARKEKICSFYLASDPRRDLEDVLEEYSKNLEPFLHLGVLYPQMSDGIREIGEIFHVRMRLLEPSVPVQPLVQREEVLGERGIFSLSRVAPVVDVEMPAREHMREYSLSSETSNSDSPRQKPRSELGGICCECCHEWSKGALCGSFPNTHTANQFFTPKVWANFCRLGRELSSPAIAALTNAQMAEINVHAGPAKFEFGDDEFVDWVDGQAMLYRIKFGEEGCSYQNRWLDTWNHRMHREAGRIAVRETCSRPSLGSFWERFMYLFSPPNNENGNLHISQARLKPGLCDFTK
ncbi:unnamed protein product [Effrenium voratum]|uniref:Uncharacterized protein n=1 Tax=Effrenium voratum TaxID=2562239 RepID=A0AA36J9P3_9DINO|nr:unnamed protein product [Effrenium voratum]